MTARTPAAGALAGRLADALRAHRRVVTVIAVAFALRLLYGLLLHPPLEFATSDMAGYLSRANRILAEPFGLKDPRLTFFPYGTHALAAAVKATFGSAQGLGFSLVNAALGAATAGFWIATAERIFPGRRELLLVVGVLSAMDVPLLLLSGFVLSEVPFGAGLAAGTFFVVRFLEGGRARDAGLAGLGFAAAIPFRPQIALSIVAVGIVVLASRRGRSLLGPRAIALGVAPILLVSAVSMARIGYHNGKLGFVSTNGALNWAFGRCHATKILTLRPAPGRYYEPPSFVRLARFEEKVGIRPLFSLDPALEEELTIDGNIYDEGPPMELASRCVAATGPLRQVKYAAIHVVLLFAYNLPWPTKGPVSDVWAAFMGLMAPGLVVAAVRTIRRRLLLEGILVAQIAALIGTAVLFFGEARLRAPYDGYILLLALGVYAPWAAALRDRYRSRRG
jgi:hypothetical protein